LPRSPKPITFEVFRRSREFYYHPEKLRGVYVEKIRKECTPAASTAPLYRAVVANRPTESVGGDLFVEANCPNCEAVSE
jgi:hypothetical protein